MYFFQKYTYKVNDENSFLDDLDRYFPQRQLIENNIDLIRGELYSLYKNHDGIPKAHEVDKYNETISSDVGSGWRTFYLKVYSGWITENCHRCPLTFQLFKDMDNVLAIMFSIMEPGNRIPPHRGELTGFLRYQLPLDVPSTGTCAITVGGETRDYKEGESFMFDDTIEHSVVNDTTEPRTVLFLDIQKNSNWLIRKLDNTFMKLIVISPKFKNANTRLKSQYPR